MLVLGAIVALLRDYIGRMYTSDEEVLALVRNILPIVAGFEVRKCVRCVCVCVCVLCVVRSVVCVCCLYDSD